MDDFDDAGLNDVPQGRNRSRTVNNLEACSKAFCCCNFLTVYYSMLLMGVLSTVFQAMLGGISMIALFKIRSDTMKIFPKVMAVLTVIFLLLIMIVNLTAMWEWKRLIKNMMLFNHWHFIGMIQLFTSCGMFSMADFTRRQKGEEHFENADNITEYGTLAVLGAAIFFILMGFIGAKKLRDLTHRALTH